MQHRGLKVGVLFWWALVPSFTSYALTNGLCLTPPMGWNSWNKFNYNVNETLVRQVADAMATNGMKDVGYEYINIDDCWQSHRDTNGVIVADTNTFPSGIKALADYVHSKGLKLGIYSDRGTNTCAHRPGSYGYEVLDASTYADWGVDYLKYDNCYAIGDMQTDYGVMRDALLNCGRPIVYSICAWQFSSWMPDYGNLWRTTTDISDSFSSMVADLDQNNMSAASAGPGRWNDPDMLEVGNGGMTDVEYRAHFSLWCIVAAPLIAGNDLRNMSPATKDILTNPEAIAVNQDPAGMQGTRVTRVPGVGGDLEVWSKPLGTNGTTKAVALFNRSATNAIVTVYWTDISLQAGDGTVRDLWTRTDLGTFVNGYSADVASHGVTMLQIVGTPGDTNGTALPRLGTNYVSNLYWVSATNGWGPVELDRSNGESAGGDGRTITLNGVTYAKGLGVHAYSKVDYHLGGVVERFQSDIGLDDETCAYGSVVFQVWADGTNLYTSGVMTSTTATETINLDISGSHQLSLVVTDAGDGKTCDHGDWADARIIVTPASSPPRISAITLAGDMTVVSGFGGPCNGLYHVRSSTNLSVPLDQWRAIATNQFDAVGNFSFTNDVNPAIPQEFLRLALP